MEQRFAQWNKEKSVTQPRQVAAKIEEVTTAHYVAVKVKRWHEAPQAWRYEIVPLRRTLVSGKAGKMTTASGLRRRAEDIGVGLGAESVRIVQNGQLFIEIGKPKPDIVLASKLYLKKHIGHPLRITLGIDMDNESTTIDLEDNTSPHLLIAGTTGSGKSVMLRHIIASLIANTSPHVVRLILMDFKVTEFPVFEYARHVDRVITSVDDALAEFEKLQAVMEERYLEMQRRRVRLAAKAGFSHIVVVMDEFADMILQGGKEIEQLIGRIAAMGRAAGIHLILSTQRPSVDVVAGLVRANFPARIALRVMDEGNSRIILGQAGAETLVGCGDSLLLLKGRLTRFQGAFVSDQEVEALVASKSRGARRPVLVQSQQPRQRPTFWERVQDFGDEMRDAWERGQQSA